MKYSLIGYIYRIIGTDNVAFCDRITRVRVLHVLTSLNFFLLCLSACTARIARAVHGGRAWGGHIRYPWGGAGGAGGIRELSTLFRKYMCSRSSRESSLDSSREWWVSNSGLQPFSNLSNHNTEGLSPYFQKWVCGCARAYPLPFSNPPVTTTWCYTTWCYRLPFCLA